MVLNFCSAAAAAAKLLQLCPILCDPIDGSPPGSPVPGILQARTLEWAVISFSSAWKWKVKGKSLSHAAAAAKSLQSCPTLCDPTDGSPPSSPISGILQTRTLEWVVIAFSSNMGDLGSIPGFGMNYTALGVTKSQTWLSDFHLLNTTSVFDKTLLVFDKR